MAVYTLYNSSSVGYRDTVFHSYEDAKYGWYFSNYDKKLTYDDGRKIKTGVTHTVDGKIILCHNGLHASSKLVDALCYAPGLYVWRVKLYGDIRHGGDKMVASNREYLWGYNATKIIADLTIQMLDNHTLFCNARYSYEELVSLNTFIGRLCNRSALIECIKRLYTQYQFILNEDIFEKVVTTGAIRRGLIDEK